MSNDTMIMPVDQDELISLDYDNIVAVAERADKMVNALNKIMGAALKITTGRDWVLIGGTPYLQESGATKVARLFGISTEIHEGFPKVERDADGYPTYHYRMQFAMGNQRVTCDGSRNSRDDFFAGNRVDKNGNTKKQKSVDEIPLEDVRRAAYTNCMNNGIKRILPGLRNLDVSDLENAGLNMKDIRGYTFKEGSKGGAKKSDDTGLKCSACDAVVSQKVASYSQSKYNEIYCYDCQQTTKPNSAQKKEEPQHTPEPTFEYSDADAPPGR